MTTVRQLSRCVLWFALCCGVLCLGACPRELEIPDAAGVACELHADCNEGVSCGELRACVNGHCEAEPSLLVPCDAGVLIDAAVLDAARDGNF